MPGITGSIIGKNMMEHYRFVIQRYMKRNVYMRTIFVIGMIFMTTLSCGAQRTDTAKAGIKLVSSGKACSAVVIPEKACEAVKFASRELRHHLKKASGVKFAEYKENLLPQGKYGSLIYLGDCKKTRELGIYSEKLPRFNGVVQTAGNNLFLAGNDEKGKLRRDTRGALVTSTGTLFSVYDMLDKELGVRWLWPGELGEFVPKKPDICITGIKRQVIPTLKYSNFWTNPIQSAPEGWGSPKNKKIFMKAQWLWLMRQRYCAPVYFIYGHAFGSYWQRFGKSNPEFFNLLPDGTRRPLKGDVTGRRMTMCVSNPVLHKRIVEEYKKIYSKKASTDIYARGNILCVCENDTPGMCTCKQCRSWDAPSGLFAEHPYWGKGIIPAVWNRFQVMGCDDGAGAENSPSLSERYAKFYLAVQKEAQKINPDVVVLGYAYANYNEPPVKTKLNDHIIISYVEWPYFPFTEQKLVKSRKGWDGWRATGARMFLRPNSTHSGHNMPIFYARRMGNEYIHAYRNGMIGVIYDSLTGQWATQGPSLYTLGRLNVNPALSVEEILDEYYSAFGPAKQSVKAYFDYWEKISNAVTEEKFVEYCKPLRKVSFKNWVQVADKIFTPEVMAKAAGLLAKAMNAAKGDSVAEARVEYLKYGFEHADMTLRTLRAQKEYATRKTKENLKKFKEARQKMLEFRKSVEDKNICDMGYLYFRERSGSGWYKYK
jgi:hypothetical protein